MLEKDVRKYVRDQIGSDNLISVEPRMGGTVGAPDYFIPFHSGRLLPVEAKKRIKPGKLPLRPSQQKMFLLFHDWSIPYFVLANHEEGYSLHRAQLTFDGAIDLVPLRVIREGESLRHCLFAEASIYYARI